MKGKIPLIPPREVHEAPRLPSDDLDSHQSWYIVQSPREEKGIAGPFNVKEMRQKYKYGEIKDSTLAWEEGQKNWEKIVHLPQLRPKLLQLPIIPVKGKDGLFDPIPPPPTQTQLSHLNVFETLSVPKSCDNCGGIAAGELVGVGEQKAGDIASDLTEPHRKKLLIFHL